MAESDAGAVLDVQRVPCGQIQIRLLIFLGVVGVVRSDARFFVQLCLRAYMYASCVRALCFLFFLARGLCLSVAVVFSALQAEACVRTTR